MRSSRALPEEGQASRVEPSGVREEVKQHWRRRGGRAWQRRRRGAPRTPTAHSRRWHRVGRACAGERVQRSFVDTVVPRPGDCRMVLIYSWSSRPHPSGVVRWCVSLSRASSSSSSASLPSYSSCPLLLLRSAPPRRHRVLFVALAPPWTAAARSCLWPPSPSTRLSDLWRVSTPWPACLSVAHSPPAVAATVACAHAPTLASFSARRPRDSIPPPPLPPPPVAWRAHAQHHDPLARNPHC